MKKLLLLLIFWSMLFSQQRLTILHWNDFHSQNLPFPVKTKSLKTNSDTTYMVGGSAAFASYLRKYSAGDSSVLILNAGDDFQGSPVSTITRGKSQIQLLNMLKPDGFAVGNHEFDYGRESLVEQFKQAAFPVLSANLLDDATGQPFAGTYIIKKVGAMKVGVIGIMTTELPNLALPANVKGIRVNNAAETINRLAPRLKKEGANIIIALTHEGVDEDSLLALAAPDIDVIVGGHSHTPLFTPKRVNGILITQAGSRGRWLGKIDLTVDTDRDTVLTSSAELIECRTSDVVPDSAVAAAVAEFEKLADRGLREVIGELHTDWKRGLGETNVGNWIADAFRSFAKTDIAIQNSGGIRKDIPAGKITVRDIWEISPFGNTLVTFTVDGATLRSMIEKQLSLGDDFCQVSGLRYVYVIRNGEKKLHNVTVNGSLLDEKKTYSIVANNFLVSQSKKYFGIALPDTRISPLNVVDRDVLIDAVKSQKVIRSSVEGRIKEAEE